MRNIEPPAKSKMAARGPKKWPTGSGKLSNPRSLGALINFRKISFWIRATFSLPFLRGKAKKKWLGSKNLFSESLSERPFYYREVISVFWFGGSKTCLPWWKNLFIESWSECLSYYREVTSVFWFGECRSDLSLRKNEIRSFKLKGEIRAEYGASLHQKYRKKLQNLFQIRGRSRIIFVSGFKWNAKI